MPSNYKAPGRLGQPDLDVQSDPRTLPELVKFAQQMGMGQNSSPGIYPKYDLAKLQPVLQQTNDGMATMYNSVPLNLPGDENEPQVSHTELSIDGPDNNNKIKLHIFKRKDAPAAPIPAVLYFHGGGMVVNATALPPHFRWCKSLALGQTIAIAVDFRNALGPDGTHHPFPAGLDDCAAAVQYIHAHRAELGISKIVLQGESGGANLSIATALKANREGWIDQIAGVFGYVPYISGAYGWSEERKVKELPSLIENEGYFINGPGMAGMAYYYSPGAGQLDDPLAWPYHATEKDLKGLPPHMLSMDELDPLRDEGMAFFRKLVAAGVRATAEVNLGTIHGCALLLRQALPEVNQKIVRHIVAFAHSL